MESKLPYTRSIIYELGKLYKLWLSLIVMIVPFLTYGTTYDLVSQYSYYYDGPIGDYNYTWAYHYIPQDPIYIDHIANAEPYTHVVQIIGNNEVLSYYQYNTHGELLSYYMFVTDQNNDMLEMNIQGSEHYFFHYLQPGMPDSIEIIRNYAPQHSYHKLEYDNQNRLITTTQYVEENSVWTPYLKHLHYYSPSSSCYPTSLNFNLTRLRNLLVGTEYFGCMLDRNVVPDSTSGYEWTTTNGWQLLYNPLVYVSLSNGQTYMSCAGYLDIYQFNSSGLCTGYCDPGYIQTHYGCSLSWYVLNSVEDQFFEPTLIGLTTYPNPFKDKLNINVKQTKDPADINIYNLKGQLIRSWKDVRTDGLTWDGKDSYNQSVSSGIYIIKARQGLKTLVTKTLKL
jgi:hypothetical protein